MSSAISSARIPADQMVSARALWLRVAAGLALTAFCVICALHVRVVIVDDGFIAHRYAANLVRGYGLVFNPGQRVEGISDPSWTLMMTIPQWAGWRPEIFAFIVGITCGIAAFVVAMQTAIARAGVSLLTGFAVFLAAAFSADYWIVAGNGIESGMYSLALVAGFALILSERFWLAGSVLGFAITLRPESLALVPLTIACLAGLRYWGSRNFGAIRRDFDAYRKLLIPWAAFVVVLFVWRLSYYDELLPNTLVAKSHPIHLSDLLNGFKYIVRFTAAVLPWALLSLFVLFRRLPGTVILGFVWIGFELIAVLANGGDWMPSFRLLIIFLPILALVAAMAFDRLLMDSPVARVPSIAAFAALCVAAGVTNREWTLHGGILQRHERAEMMAQYYEPSFIRFANVIKPVLRPDDVIAPEVLGVVSYILLDSPMHDWLGLVDAHIAHHGTVFYPMFGKAEPDYTVETVRPAVFAFASGLPTIQMFERHTHGEFGRRYDCWQAAGRPLIIALRRDREAALLPTLRENFELAPISPD